MFKSIDSYLLPHLTEVVIELIIQTTIWFSVLQASIIQQLSKNLVYK